MQLLVGSYSEGKPDGIRRVDFDPAAGRFGATTVLEGAPDASYFAYDRVNHRLYVTDEPAALVAGWSIVHGIATLALTGNLDRSGARDLFEGADLSTITRRSAGLLFGPSGPPESEG